MSKWSNKRISNIHDPWCGYWYNSPAPTPPPTYVTRLYGIGMYSYACHGYIINIEDMSVLKTVNYDTDLIDTLSDGNAGTFRWNADLGQFLTMAHLHTGPPTTYQIIEIGIDMEISRRTLPGLIVVGDLDGNYYVNSHRYCLRSDGYRPTSGGTWPTYWQSVGTETWNNIGNVIPWAADGSGTWSFFTGTQPTVDYISGKYYCSMNSGGINYSTYVDRDTGDWGWPTDYYAAGDIYSFIHEGYLYTFKGAGTQNEFYKRDLTTLAAASSIAPLNPSGDGRNYGRPFFEGSIMWVTYFNNDTGQRHLIRVDLDSMTITHTYVDTTNRITDVYKGVDGVLYGHKTIGFALFDPDDLTLLDTYANPAGVGIDADGGLTSGQTTDGQWWLFATGSKSGVGYGSSCVHKYGPLGGTFAYVESTLNLVCSLQKKIQCVETTV